MIYCRARFGVLCVLMLGVLSCSINVKSPAELNKNIDQWVLTHNYDKISAEINKINKSNIIYKEIFQRQADIENDKKRYIADVEIKANKYKLSNSWQQAIDVYKDALENIRKSPRLISALNGLLEDREEGVNKLRKKLMLKQANALISYQPIYMQLKQLVPNDVGAKADIKKYRKQRDEIAEQLRLCGVQEYENNRFKQSRECFFLSNKLINTQEKSRMVNALDLKIRSYEDNAKYEKYFNLYKKELALGSLSNAKLSLEKAIKIKPYKSQAKVLMEKLNSGIMHIVKEKIYIGKKYYSQKRINESLILWKQAKKLDPENQEINQLIVRAEKVSKKIESLKYKR